MAYFSKYDKLFDSPFFPCVICSDADIKRKRAIMNISLIKSQIILIISAISTYFLVALPCISILYFGLVILYCCCYHIRCLPIVDENHPECNPNLIVCKSDTTCTECDDIIASQIPIIRVSPQSVSRTTCSSCSKITTDTSKYIIRSINKCPPILWLTVIIYCSPYKSIRT